MGRVPEVRAVVALPAVVDLRAPVVRPVVDPRSLLVRLAGIRLPADDRVAVAPDRVATVEAAVFRPPVRRVVRRPTGSGVSESSNIRSAGRNGSWLTVAPDCRSRMLRPRG
ncbi:MAG TPA: hypothetical protein VKZ67_06540 [Natronosporangium sp.]|nr:hypothetical protein [Natronosporangium sp.]